MNPLEQSPELVTARNIHRDVAADLDRVLFLMRSKLKEQGFSQVEVQRRLGWKGSYLSQLFNRTKALRVEQLLAVLRVIGVEPKDFFDHAFEPSAAESTARERKEAWLHFAREALEVMCEKYEVKPFQSTMRERQP